MKLHIVFACCVVLLFGGFYASNSLTTIQASNLAVEPAQAVDPSGLVSDDFNEQELDTDVWTFVQPSVGPISGTLTFEPDDEPTNAIITLPEGTEFESWREGHNATRIMQDANNEDFEVDVKFESFPAPSTSQGIMVELDGDRFMRFEFYRDPDGNLFGFIAELAPNGGGNPYAPDGSVTQEAIEDEDVPADTIPLYLRLTRTGDSFTLSYSIDDQNYTEIGSKSTQAALARVGVYVANPEPSGGTAPAFIGSIDYFKNTADVDFVDDPEPVPTPTATEEPTETPTMEPGEPTATPTMEPGEPTATPTMEPGEPTATPTAGPVDPSEGIFLPLIIR